MAEYYYRETDGVSRRAMGPYETVDEARKAARYKGLTKIEVLRKSGTGFETVDHSSSAAKPAAGVPGRL